MADFLTLNILNLRYDWPLSITLCHHQPVTGADTPKTTALRFVHVVEKFVWGLRVIISKSKKNELYVLSNFSKSRDNQYTCQAVFYFSINIRLRASASARPSSTTFGAKKNRHRVSDSAFYQKQVCRPICYAVLFCSSVMTLRSPNDRSQALVSQVTRPERYRYLAMSAYPLRKTQCKMGTRYNHATN